MAEEKTEGQEQAPKKKSKLMLIIIIVVVLALAGGGAAFFFLGKKGGGEGGEGAGKAEAKKEPKKGEEPVTFPLDPFIVNLGDQTGNKYLKVTLHLELANALFVERAKNRVPQLRDAVISILTSKTSDALISAEGKIMLKDEVNIRANQIMGEGSVKNVYLTEFVMQ